MKLINDVSHVKIYIIHNKTVSSSTSYQCIHGSALPRKTTISENQIATQYPNDYPGYHHEQEQKVWKPPNDEHHIHMPGFYSKNM
jgi:hypothetical protein